MKSEKKQLDKFPGFPPEPTTNYWPYPRALNGWWYSLSGSEQKVLDYILRHTWGFKKTADKISLTQFETGVRNLDKGVGLSRPAIVKAIKGLVRKGFIRKIKGRPNKYEMVKDFNYLGKSSLPKDGKDSLHTINDSSIKDLQEDLEDWFYRIGKPSSLAVGVIKKYGFENVKRAYQYTCDSGGTIDTFFRELKGE